jgi:hypothetical protein
MNEALLKLLLERLLVLLTDPQVLVLIPVFLTTIHNVFKILRASAGKRVLDVIRSVSEEVVQAVEQTDKTLKIKLTPEQKREMAVKMARETLNRLGIRGVAEDLIIQQLEAALNRGVHKWGQPLLVQAQDGNLAETTKEVTIQVNGAPGEVTKEILSQIDRATSSIL